MFRVFPQTRLYQHAWSLTDLCLSAPIEPSQFIKAVEAPSTLTFRPGRAVRSPCLSRAAWTLEATVVGRSVDPVTGVVKIAIDPVHVEPGAVQAYSRPLGCIIELLIWYTRAVAARRYTAAGVEQREAWCKRLTRYAKALPAIMECIAHTAEEGLAMQACKLAYRLVNQLYAAGCQPPEGLEEEIAQVCPLQQPYS